MALKDWKLISRVRFENRHEDNWTNQTNGDRLQVRLVKGFRGENKYEVNVDGKILKTTNTKQKALKSAKVYRITH